MDPQWLGNVVADAGMVLRGLCHKPWNIRCAMASRGKKIRMHNHRLRPLVNAGGKSPGNTRFGNFHVRSLNDFVPGNSFEYRHHFQEHPIGRTESAAMIDNNNTR